MATAPTEAPKKSLVKKLAEVMGEVDRVPKSGRNEFHRYDYATEADIVAAVRTGMAERSVMLIPSITKIEWSERQTKNGIAKIATITVHFTFLDGDSAEKVEFDGMGQGEDASDKAIYKAMTGAEKYALLKTFLIPTGDDPEDDSGPAGKRSAPRDNSRREASAPVQQRSATPPPKQEPPKKLEEPHKDLSQSKQRAQRLWQSANSAGVKWGDFGEWSQKALGSLKPYVQWEESDLDVLEKATKPWEDNIPF